MTTPDDLDVVLTKRGRRLHYAKPGEWHTLCFRAVAQRREGGSWTPQMPRDVDHWATCLRCLNLVVKD